MIGCMTTNPEANRRYKREIGISMTIYVLLVFITVYLIKHGMAAPWTYVVATLPVFPALMVPVAINRFFRSMDELQRRIQLEGLAFAFTLTAILTLSYGFLQNAGLPDISWIWIWPLMGFLWAIGLGIARRRYR